jgi:hypothetical protein
MDDSFAHTAYIFLPIRRKKIIAIVITVKLGIVNNSDIRFG